MRHLTAAAFLLAAPALADPLPSWSEGPARAQIIAFVDSVTDPASDDFVPVADRIAVFDNDGTLWAEQPLYFQAIYAFDTVKKIGAEDPSTLTSDALKAAAKGDIETVMAGGEKALLDVVGLASAGQTIDAFQAGVSDWLADARHPTTGMAYDAMTYQPMVELLRYLRDEGFRTYIVSGGGIDFMRVFAERAYGIPTDQVLGSYGDTSYTVGDDGVPVITKTKPLVYVDDKEGKPINIMRILGKRPIFAAGNSDGDFAMLQWTTAGDGPSLGLIVHHTDADREWAYDRDSHIGQLARGLDDGPGLGWVIVDMAKDWDRIWSSQR
ncbi:MAG: HAD family hydrolase [Rhodobacteraceae bacterium]|nr:HAD family hydrolase [Paracoccaceae bacterium]